MILYRPLRQHPPALTHVPVPPHVPVPQGHPEAVPTLSEGPSRPRHAVSGRQGAGPRYPTLVPAPPHAPLYRRGIQKLYPHDPDMLSLAVKGQALETQLEDLAYAPITLPEVEQQLAGTDLGAYEAYMVRGGGLTQGAHHPA